MRLAARRLVLGSAAPAQAPRTQAVAARGLPLSPRMTDRSAETCKGLDKPIAKPVAARLKVNPVRRVTTARPETHPSGRLPRLRRTLTKRRGKTSVAVILSAGGGKIGHDHG